MKIRERDGTVRDMTAEEIAAREADQQGMIATAHEQQTLENLAKIDLRSIRAMREVMAPTNPRLHELEGDAVVERAKLPERG